MSRENLIKNSTTLQAWVLAARPKTLTASIVPILAATALAISTLSNSRTSITSSFPWSLGFLSLLCALLIQIGTNFINDALDFQRGADTKERLGPKRVVASGLLDIRNVWRGGIICFVMAIIISIPLVQSGGLPILLIGIFSIMFGYLYTGGPRPLAYLGLGEIFVLIFFGWIAVSGLFYLYCGFVSLSALIAGTQIGLLATSLIAINNLRDYKGDILANKLTLAARFGLNWGRNQIKICCYFPFIFSIYWVYIGSTFAAMLPLSTLPVALQLVRNISAIDPSEEYNKFLAKAAFLHLIFGILLSAGLIIDSLI